MAEAWWAQRHPNAQPATPAQPTITAWDALTAGAASVWQWLHAAARQPGYLRIDAPHGLVPATGPQFDTALEPLARQSTDGALVGLIEETYDGGVLIVLGSEDAAYAGRLLQFVCVAQETDRIVLQGFSVLPDTPKTETGCYQSYLQANGAMPQELRAWAAQQIA